MTVSGCFWLDSLKGVILGIIQETGIGATKEDTRILDHSSDVFEMPCSLGLRGMVLSLVDIHRSTP